MVPPLHLPLGFVAPAPIEISHFISCELCSTERSSAPTSHSLQLDRSDRWECSASTFNNVPLVLCCEMYNQLRSSITDEIKGDVAKTSAAAETGSSYKASSAAAAQAIAHTDKRKATARNVESRELPESSSYCSSCSGNFMSAHALQTHQCSHAPLAKRARLQGFNIENSQSSRGPVVIPNFVTAEHEAEILAALDLDQTVTPFYGGSATVSHIPVWGRDQSYYNMWNRSFRSPELGLCAQAVDFPNCVKTIVIDRMLQLPELHGWAPDSVSAHVKGTQNFHSRSLTLSARLH
jgi:hypothetical protein